MASDEEILLRQYLGLLGTAQGAPSVEGLRMLIAAQLSRVPFENISKLWYLRKLGLKGIPSLEQYVDGIERYHFGGTCYANNYYFGRLLTSLGYDVRLCGADMTNPDVHLVNLVALDGREYLVDVGYGAPFTIPIPRDAKENFVISFGKDRYVLGPQNGEGRSRLDLYRNGELVHGYTVKPASRAISFFLPAISGSFRPTATFMNAILVARYAGERGMVIHNQTILEINGAEVGQREIAKREDIPATIEEVFGIPRAIVSEAVAQIGEFTNPWN